MSLWKYAPVTSNVTTFLLSCASIAMVINTDLLFTIGDAAFSFKIYCCCIIPLTHALAFISPLHFLTINMSDARALSFSSFDRVSLSTR